MSKRGLPPRFRVNRIAPTAVAAHKAQKTGRFRGSPRERGYDAKWDRISIEFRKRHPFCLFCSQQGRDTLVDLVDHVLPVVDRPDLRHDWNNLIQLCVHCHGLKARLENEARTLGDINLLKVWVYNPDSRPEGLRPVCL